MGATSVTGVGPGSAEKKNKGSERMTLGAEQIIGPRIVYANSVTTDAEGDAVIKLPELAGTASNYVVVATESGVAAAAAVAANLTISGGVSTVTVKGPASTVIAVLVVKTGLAV
jgi:hypothetical protein